MARFSLVGGSFPSQSPYMSIEDCINWIPEPDQSGNGISATKLIPRPGLYIFAQPGIGGLQPNVPISAVLPYPSQTATVPYSFLFVVQLPYLFAYSTDQAAFIRFGPMQHNGVNITSGPCSMAVNSTNQLLVNAGGYLFVLNYTTLTLSSEISFPGANPVQQVGFSDGFFVALMQNSQTFFVSNAEDGTVWNGTEYTQVSEFPDLINGMLVDHREIWLGGVSKALAYYNSGDPNFPFAPIPGAFVEQGCGAGFSMVRLDNSIFWLGQDERGFMVAWRMNGYTPVRVSNSDVEYVWQNYPKTSDAIAFPYQIYGHALWVIYFPTSQATWVFDASTGIWSQWAYWDGSGTYKPYPAQCHAYWADAAPSGNPVVPVRSGLHIMGSPNGYLYASDPGALSDGAVYNGAAGKAIRFQRTSPYIANENQWVYHTFLQVLMDVGQTTVSTPNGPRGAELVLSWTDDGGHTWSNDHILDCGQQGQYKQRVYLNRLGRARQRAYRLVGSDPCPYRILDGYVEATGYERPTQRLSTQIKKSA